MLRSVFELQLRGVKRNRGVFLLIVATTLGVIYVGLRHGTLIQCAAYLVVMYLSALCVDYFALRNPPKNELPVRAPKKEAGYFVLCFAVGAVFFFVRFSGIVDWQNLQPLVRFAFVPFLAFIYPIALAAILLILRYTPNELGLRVQGLMVVVPIIVLSAITNRLVTPESLTWSAVMEEGGGIVGTLFLGFIVAGLSEEFFRVIGQTRLGAFFGNRGLGWYVTTVLWALMHAPNWYGQSHDLAEALLGSVRIIPLGLLWGYVTHRTKSFLPAVIIHGANVWGLQNF